MVETDFRVSLISLRSSKGSMSSKGSTFLTH